MSSNSKVVEWTGEPAMIQREDLVKKDISKTEMVTDVW